MLLRLKQYAVENKSEVGEMQGLNQVNYARSNVMSHYQDIISAGNIHFSCKWLHKIQGNSDKHLYSLRDVVTPVYDPLLTCTKEKLVAPIRVNPIYAS